MNVIKFLDTVVEDKDWYNDNLRGKYAYWIHCKYVVSFDSLEESMYYELERMNNEEIIAAFDEDTIPYLDLGGDDLWVNAYVDTSATELANSIETFKTSNSFVPDDDITLEELKQFRSWLAETMLTMKEWDDNNRHILMYYKNGMSDDTVKWLSIFGVPKIGVTIGSGGIVPCGCSGNGNLSSLYNESLISCDSLSIYKNNIKLAMITLFSNINTWTGFPVDFIREIIKYLKGIIKANLPLVSTSSTLDIYSCKCLGDTNYAQSQAQAILTDLIDAFEWIAEDEVNGHKNSIATVLTNWATNLYEIMEWN